MTEIFTKIYDELRAVPAVMTLVIGLYFAVGAMWLSYAPLSDVQAVRASLKDVKYTIERAHLDTRMHEGIRELSQLKQQIKEWEAKNKDVDQWYYARARDLEFEQEDITRQSNLLDRGRQ